MAISASNIVEVLPRILTGTGSDLVFNGLVLDDNAVLKNNTPTSFSSADSVAKTFGANSDEYTFASTYFSGYANSRVKPSALYFYRLNPASAPAFVRGVELKPADALTALKAITAGTFNITISGNNVALLEHDLSSLNSLTDIASDLQTAIRAKGTATEDGVSEDIDALKNATVEYSATLKAFTVSSGDTGDTASVTSPTGTIAEALGFASDTDTISGGANFATVSETMTAVTAQFQNFVTFTTLKEPEDEDAMLLAKWATTQANAGTLYLYVCYDSSAGNLDENNTTCIVEQMKAEEIGATCMCYPDSEKAAFIMGTAASIAWEQRNGAITLAFKSQNGMGADVQDTDDANALDAHGVNYVGNFATRNDGFVFLYNGQMLGDWEWIDTYLNACWICNALQVQIMSGFTSAGRVPYTEAGYAMIRAWCKDVILRALNNGVIDAGVSLSETQKATLISELGDDYSDEIYNNGYYLQIVDATAQIRQQRKSPTCNFVYTYGGSVHRLTLPALAVV